MGVLMLLGFMKLNNATDELKRISMKNDLVTTEDYEEVISLYGKYMKMISIASIVSIVMSIIGFILYILIFAAIFSSGMNGFSAY